MKQVILAQDARATSANRSDPEHPTEVFGPFDDEQDANDHAVLLRDDPRHISILPISVLRETP